MLSPIVSSVFGLLTLLALAPSPAGADEVSPAPARPPRILTILAHPDDEVFLAGTLTLLARHGATQRVVYTTSGSAGENKHLRGMRRSLEKGLRRVAGVTAGLVKTPLTTGVLLARKREREARNALRAMGLEDVAFFLRFRDGHTAERYFPLAERLRDEIDRFRPDVIFSFSLDGATGHRDHITAVAATLVALQRSSVDPWVFGLVMTPERAALYRPFWRMRTTSDERIDLVVNVDSCDEERTLAFACHRSQFLPHDTIRYARDVVARDDLEPFVVLRRPARSESAPLPSLLPVGEALERLPRSAP